MSSITRQVNKGFSILLRRLRAQGLRTTFLWAFGRILPGITGVPLLQYCEVTPQLYVGSQFNALGKRLLIQHGIRSSVNMRIERDDAPLGLAMEQYLYLPTLDDEAPSIAHLDQGVEFIRKVTADGGKVYIHCGAGVGRAPTMAAAYLIAEGYRVDEALAMIRKVRPFITITEPQLARLSEYETRLRREAASTSEKITV